MVLVVDVIKGVQTQTAECLIIGEIICSKMLVVLNKIDLIPENKKVATIEKMSKRMQKTLESTKFAGCPITAVSANPGASESDCKEPEGISNLIQVLQQNTYVPQRSAEGPFIFSVDHCFSIRGQGTVMTGTVLSGQVCVNNTVEISSVQECKKVKSIQMFHKPTQSVKQGDRAGICVTQFDPKLLERGLVCSPGALPTLYAAIVTLSKINYFSGEVRTKMKFHVTIGHSTVMARIALFGFGDDGTAANHESKPLDDAVEGLTVTDMFDFSRDYAYQDELIKGKGLKQWALLEFEKPVVCRPNSLVIGSKLDSDIHANKCRLAFRAQIVEAITDKEYSKMLLPKLKVYKNKTREGAVERIHDDYNVICKGLLKKETDVGLFTGLKVSLSSGEQGLVEGSFGLSGKVKVRVPTGLSEETKAALAGKGKKSRKKTAGEPQAIINSEGKVVHVTMNFKHYVYDPSKKMTQS
uniref:Selenocysteine-specific elongation factor n=1 Tax=Phallusia mammillata TaxID=59560 RepID=A0A6F9DB13_9ASCI|nr:selenocysteine-specific elongation factor [Phallusia mammillata]